MDYKLIKFDEYFHEGGEDIYFWCTEDLEENSAKWGNIYLDEFDVKKMMNFDGIKDYYLKEDKVQNEIKYYSLLDNISRHVDLDENESWRELINLIKGFDIYTK